MGRLNLHINKFRLRWLLLPLLYSWGCTDPFVIETIDLERLLVVEATLTDALKHQEIRLSRTVGLEEFEQSIEREATVMVEDSDGNRFDFSFDDQASIYISHEKFAAMANTLYTVHIITPDGHSYSSDEVALTPTATIDDVYAALNPNMEAGEIQVLVDVDETGEAQYFRYEYEETYKVVLPHPSPFRWNIIEGAPSTRNYSIELLPHRLDLACYVTGHSSGITQTSTSTFAESRIARFPVHSIDIKDPVIRDRYSILVKQYVQSLEAHTFYQTLTDLGSSESLLSQAQPGFVQGNIFSNSHPDEKVLGFFQVASYMEKRAYFNYEDFGLESPPYFVECDHLLSYEIGPNLLRRKLEFENYQVFLYEETSVNGSPPQMIYHISQPICTDCPVNSSHIKPDFWIE